MKQRKHRCLSLLLALTLMGRGAPAEAAAGTARVAAEDGAKYVALTFDDGPRADTTSVLLAGLDERDAKATFFLIGRQIAGNEDLVERMEEEGHQVGSHTWNHVRLTDLSQDTLRREGSAQTVAVRLEQAEFAARDYGSFRLPGGTYTALRIELGKAEGHNWFCVLYPELCIGSSGAQYEDDAENALVFGGYEIRFALLDGAKKLADTISNAVS